MIMCKIFQADDFIQNGWLDLINLTTLLVLDTE